MALSTSGSKGAESAVRSGARPLATPPTPGAVLRELLRADKRVTQERLARSMGVSRVTVNQLVNGRCAVTAEMALRLAQALRTSPDLWLNLQRGVDLAEARGKLRSQLTTIRPVRGPVSERSLFVRLKWKRGADGT